MANSSDVLARLLKRAGELAVPENKDLASGVDESGIDTSGLSPEGLSVTPGDPKVAPVPPSVAAARMQQRASGVAKPVKSVAQNKADSAFARQSQMASGLAHNRPAEAAAERARQLASGVAHPAGPDLSKLPDSGPTVTGANAPVSTSTVNGPASQPSAEPAAEPSMMDQALGKAKEWGTAGYNAAKPVVEQGLSAAKNYMAGSIDNPAKWMGAHPIGTGIAGGIGAAMLLHHLMSRPKKRRPQPKMAGVMDALKGGAKAVGGAAEQAVPVRAMAAAAKPALSGMGQFAAKHPVGTSSALGAAVATPLALHAAGGAPAPAAGAPSAAPAAPAAPAAAGAAKSSHGLATAGVIGGGLAATALLAHVLSGPSNDEDSDSDEE